MISVVIPTLNEEESIANVVQFAKRHPLVNEVIVVDDKSADKTVSIARQQGAKVITSTKLGKGASMKDGALCASNNIIVYLDGDIDPYPEHTIDVLTKPIVDGEVDFVKSSFDRNAGRVTELVAKPLLSIFFPDLLRFSQPLSGMIAARKSLLQEISFRDDYGVDIGILIDAALLNTRMKEVVIGYITNKSKPWTALGKMSKEVAHTIITKAAASNNPHYNLEELGVLNEIRSQMDFSPEVSLNTANKAIVFDMDNTILNGRFIDRCAEIFDFKDELMNLRSSEHDAVLLAKRIAMMLKGRTIRELLDVVECIPIVDDTAYVVNELKSRGYIVGIISDSYDCITTHIKSLLGMDFSLSNELEFSKSICTGEVKIPSFLFSNRKSLCKHAVCKSNALLSILERYNIPVENSIAVGDSANDLCMIRTARIGVSFCSKDELLCHYADVTIQTHSFSRILSVAQ